MWLGGRRESGGKPPHSKTTGEPTSDREAMPRSLHCGPQIQRPSGRDDKRVERQQIARGYPAARLFGGGGGLGGGGEGIFVELAAGHAFVRGGDFFFAEGVGLGKLLLDAMESFRDPRCNAGT